MNLKREGHILNNFAAAMLCGTAMGLLAFCFEQIVALRIGHAATHLEETVSPQSYWQAILITVLVAPLIEEFISRKLIIDFALRKSFPVIYAMLASAIFFSAGHLFRLSSAEVLLKAAILSGTFLDGLVLAAIYIRTERIIYPVIAHIFINAFLSAPKSALEANVNSQNALIDYLPFVATTLIISTYLMYFVWVVWKDATQRSDNR